MFSYVFDARGILFVFMVKGYEWACSSIQIKLNCNDRIVEVLQYKYKNTETLEKRFDRIIYIKTEVLV